MAKECFVKFVMVIFGVMSTAIMASCSSDDESQFDYEYEFERVDEDFISALYNGSASAIITYSSDGIQYRQNENGEWEGSVLSGGGLNGYEAIVLDGVAYRNFLIDVFFLWELRSLNHYLNIMWNVYEESKKNCTEILSPYNLVVDLKNKKVHEGVIGLNIVTHDILKVDGDRIDVVLNSKFKIYNREDSVAAKQYSTFTVTPLSSSDKKKYTQCGSEREALLTMTRMLRSKYGNYFPYYEWSNSRQVFNLKKFEADLLNDEKLEKRYEPQNYVEPID